ncbi:hypothetical protein DUNSADRAFT_787 [Dunaliella salina]|uniref:Sacsin/Nov domain-containing protein n=1 Tax=Dunaliella salina TaxID=3046 RepID=A0ABQ7FYC5_DUNSA|nr:hypothetical protein DUNSADRAFT_787 [Dunaliella salina]|eukprot:KAF5827365.1 hypothetical protein DUNSADRAFT_787 [Dunaliella salina]
MAAVQCNCPPSRSRTQWPAVFQEAVGSLDDPELLDDAMARDGWTALELPGGQLIKVPNTTTLKADFKEGLAHLDPVATVATLLGYVAQEGNCSQVVLEPLIVCICERMRNEKKFSGTAEAHKLLTRFVLRCLSLIPSVLRPMLAHHVFLTPLMTEVMDGDAQVTARHLLQCASTIDEDEHSDDNTTSTAGQGRCLLLPMLHALGMHLKLKDLQEHYVEVVWKAGQAAAQDAPGQSAETAVSCTSVAAGMNSSHGGPVEPSSAAGPLKGTSAEAAGGADDAIELLPHSLRAHFEGKRTAPGPAAGATKQEQHPEGTAGGLEPAQAAVAVATKEEQDAQAVIMQIRTEEFDLVDAQHMTQDKKKRNEREGRMLKMLSKDLYSEAHHFQMELVQNADDNHYSPDTVPLLTFDVFDDKILVKNNELGFSAENVRKICTIGDSSKKNKQGYTGEKGIGFKSVFKVTDKPAVHSNHFHFAFDLTADKMLGYIVPSPVRPLPLDMHNPKEVTTCIELPLKEEFQGRRPESRELRDKFNNLCPVLLLFLRNLRRININNVAGQSFHTILADQDSVYPNCLRLRSMRMSYAKGAEQADVVDTSSKWIHVDKVLQPRNPRQGEKIERTCVSVAYPLPKGTDDHELPQRQPVYAYLPVRSYGLKFVVNANWEVPPSREAVYGLSAFNIELASAIPDLAMEALALLKQMPTPRQDRPHFWIDWWLKTLPVDGEVDEPFVSPARQFYGAKLVGKAGLRIWDGAVAGEIQEGSIQT